MKNKPLQLFILKSETPNNLSIDPLYRIYDVCLKDMIFIKSFPFWIFVSILWIKTRQKRNKITGKLSRALIDKDSHRANQTTDGMSWDTLVHGSPEPVLTRTGGRGGRTPHFDDVRRSFVSTNNRTPSLTNIPYLNNILFNMVYWMG